jgi:hypothetical protein
MSEIRQLPQRGPLRVIGDSDAVPLERPDPEVIAVAEEVLLLAREGRLRGIGLAMVTRSDGSKDEGKPQLLTTTRFVCTEDSGVYALYTAVRRLGLRVEQNYI